MEIDKAFELTEQELSDQGAAIDETSPLHRYLSEFGEANASPALDVIHREVFRAVTAGLIGQRSDLTSQIEDLTEEHNQQVRSIFKKIITLADSLDRLIRQSNPENELSNALVTLRTEFFQILEDFDLIPVDLTVGEVFNKDYCEVGRRVARPDLPPETIISIERRGYTWKGKLFRPARVNISFQPKGA